MYDAALWNMALIASRLHLVWIATVCGKLKTDFRYSNTLGWNTFPVPPLTEKNKADLTACAEDILLAREHYFPATIADMYDPDRMDTGDAETDRLLEDARRRILSPHPADRQDALEKLWDAFERIKTLEPGADKRTQATRLLERTVPSASPRFRQFLETEAAELTKIGNTLRIRHSETDKEPLHSLEQADYLFHRMFSFLRLVLRTTGRGG